MNFKTKFVALSISVLMLIALICPMTLVGAEGNLEVTAADVYAERGEIVEVVFTVDSNPGFAALMVDIVVPEGAKIIEIRNGSVMKDMSIGDNILWDSAADSCATGELLIITLKITDEAELGEHLISIEVAQCYNDKLEEVSVSVSSAKVIVVETEAETESDTTEEATCEKTEESVFESETDKKSDGQESEKVSETERKPEESADNDTAGEGGCSSKVSGLVLVTALIGSAIAFARKKNR